ncbi:hypothetical protein LR48_Vigan04g127400 [Vigna angularis]|uniref:Uncharacterized protein n=1 Tax=Phaseolus angularis TaxID=3914 RepID=A0A0L9UEE6_PHAAN|nr:hypothetical protein LR48_Vigan04g127400 [Vigna angularis]
MTNLHSNTDVATLLNSQNVLPTLLLLSSLVISSDHSVIKGSHRSVNNGLQAQEMVRSAVFTRSFSQEQLLRPFDSLVLVNLVQALAHRSVTTKPFPCSPIMLNNVQVVANRSVQGNSCIKVILFSTYRSVMSSVDRSVNASQTVPSSHYKFCHSVEASVDRSMLGHPVQAYNRPLGQSFQDRSVFILLEDRSVKALADRSVIFSRSFLNLSIVIVLHKMIEIVKLK